MTWSSLLEFQQVRDGRPIVSVPPLIYVFQAEVLPGLYAGKQDSWTHEDYQKAMPEPALTHQEARWVLYNRIVFSHTYSMQQGDFARAGFEVTSAPWSVKLPPRSLVIGIGTRDRYGIFDPEEGPTVVTCETVREWRDSPWYL